MNHIYKLMGLALTGILACEAIGSMQPATQVEAAKNVVVCIDPGHGGTNFGAQYNDLQEKNLTLQIANAMYQELSQYEGVTIVMTRTDDAELSLSDRAQIAKKANADFLYSIHLNASTEHNLFGSEVWTSAFGDYYAKGQSFGRIETQELSTQIGVYTRGVKTKLSEAANMSRDYYGVINAATNLGIPSVIIEHCYMDEAHDTNFYMEEGDLEALGKADATAVAKYFGLKSKALGVDYSSYEKASIAAPATPVAQDLTPPETAQITCTGYDANSRVVKLHVTAKDSNSKIIYYSYTTDGGASWSVLCGWTANGEGDVEITLPESSNGQVAVAVYNQYDLCTVSNLIQVK